MSVSDIIESINNKYKYNYNFQEQPTSTNDYRQLATILIRVLLRRKNFTLGIIVMIWFGLMMMMGWIESFEFPREVEEGFYGFGMLIRCSVCFLVLWDGPVNGLQENVF